MMNIAGVAIISYFLKRTIPAFSDVGRVDAMVTILAFGNTYNLYAVIKEDVGKTFGGYNGD